MFGDWDSNAECDRATAQVRYVDDLLIISRCMCGQCMQRLVTAAHPGIPFGCEGSSDEGPLRWLDLVIHTPRHPPHVATGMPELSWASGVAPAPTKFRIRPFSGRQHCERGEMRSFVRSKLARWACARIGHGVVERAVAYECMVLARSGYPWRLIREAWVGGSRDHILGDVVERFLQDLEALRPQRNPTGAGAAGGQAPGGGPPFL